MSSKRFGIDIALNTNDVAKGAKDAEKSLEKLEDAVEDVGKGGARDAERLEDALRDVQRQTERAEDALDDMRGTGADSMERIGEGAQEVQQEFGQNLSQAVSSFRGEMEDLGQIGQDTLGGLAGTVAGMGPGGLAGAFALAAGAAGLGLLTAGIQEAEEATQRAAERAAEWADKFIESGERVATAGQQAADILDIYTDPDRYKDATDAASEWGVSTDTAVRALAGSESAIQVVTDAVSRLKIASAEEAAEAQRVAEANGAVLLGQTNLEQQYGKARDRLTELTDAQAQGRVVADEASESLLNLISQYKNLGIEVDELGNKLITLPDGEQIVIDVDTKRASLDLDKFKGDVDEVIDEVNGRDLVLGVRADLQAAEREMNSFLRQRRTVTIEGVVIGRNQVWD